MYLLKSCAIAFSMYSKIPMPRVDWNEKNMKYAMCFFPVVGGVLGVLEVIVGGLLLDLGAGTFLFAAAMTLLPVLVTGGIHMDGFMDTMDALSSYGDREKKLAILKDSNSGAFAILGMCCYFLWNAAIWSEVTKDMLPVIACGYVISRSMSGFSVVTFPAARNSGLARTFQDGAQKKTVRAATSLCFLAAGALMLILSPVLGTAALAAAVLVFLYYRHTCKKQFGGITGDLAGYFLQLCELAMLTVIVLAGGIGWR
ncbi:adenosylcobinamide-GDP ribazoletransferase [Faecalicatena contorta]|uniref:adenosylcobinamide-GDP ribazoletransferase n=1 Tax=Faecalicatena contorta TaxID=39482 RepID=UPI00129E905A|nr:adenosylcobinamide-GDP ribazoletransferase [Faecalicatena contorta]MEE0203302.1 adenosylcobinamide-GDP ribazoletransferase [Muricomes sp.]MRM90887.1 adenosylcobinamide-GDP ribazoletransferase [Faecalicatena contorta]